MTSLHNRYCQHLGIPVPRIEDVAGRPEVTLFQLVVMALLERGGPMTLEEIAARLDRATLPARLARPEFVAAVKKAWHGQPPLVRDGDERLALDLLSSEFRHITFVAGLQPSVLSRQGPAELRLPTDEDPRDAADPWKHAVRATIADRVEQHLVIRTAGGVQALSMDDIHAVRVADSSAAATVRPRHTYPDHHGVYQLMVTLDGIEPPIWRRLVVPAWFTLEKLHGVLQTALGWTNSHLHLFQFGDERVGIPYELGDLDETYTRSGRIVHLGDLVARGHRRMIYEYDFGDGWTHTIEIDDVPDEEGPSLACLDGARACPPEDCGGVDGYHRLLEILFDPTHEEFEDSRQWVGPAFAPERFDLRLVNLQLERQRFT